MGPRIRNISQRKLGEEHCLNDFDLKYEGHFYNFLPRYSWIVPRADTSLSMQKIDLTLLSCPLLCEIKTN